ncbi:phage protein [Vibrio harveyi]|uniref:regulator n=1 Tax=Vibrio harveyi TaxID=669 RepID=UPI00288E574D|nr:phage protein [Vibrio harveyi]ELH4834947.1 phage protein [Vibrio harveyi]
MKYHEMTKKYIFREFECGLSVELCFKRVKTIKSWDEGKSIPKECKRLMRKQCRFELSYEEEWKGFKMKNSKLEVPTGQFVTPKEILAGIGLLSIQSELEIKTSTKILQYARAIARYLR